MQIITDGSRIPAPCVAALGNFDGVHLGHAALIREAAARAREMGIFSCVYTFSSHPAGLLSGKGKALLTDNREKAELIAAFGVDFLYFDDFAAVRALSPGAFCRDVLIERLHAVLCICGENYSFGKDRAGTSDTLKSEFSACGGKALILPSVRMETACGSLPVSSTAVRYDLSDGDAESAAALLGRPYFFSAPVIHGERLARRLGFPTINQIFPPEKLRPKNGVYISCCEIDGTVFHSVTNIGVKPTVTDGKKNPPVLCETHLIGGAGDLYGKTARIAFYRRLRDEKKFENLAALTEAIRDNVDRTVRYFSETEHLPPFSRFSGEQNNTDSGGTKR